MADSNRKRFWADYSTAAFAALDHDSAVAVLPLGATEQHGPHLPMSVDTVSIDAIVDGLSGRLPSDCPAVFLPTIPISLSIEHLDFAGSLSFSPGTLLTMLSEIGAQVAQNGFRKMVLLNGHGGNTALLDVAARKMRIDFGLWTVALNWFATGFPEGLYSETEQTDGIHAGDMETSLMLHIAPQQVDMTLARDFGNRAAALHADHPDLGLRGPGKFGWSTQDLNPSGACGDASRASAEKGQRTLDHAVERVSDVLLQISRVSLDRALGAPDWPLPRP